MNNISIKIVITTLLLLQINKANAQNIDSLNEKYFYYFKIKNYDSALPLAIDIRNYYIKKNGTENSETVVFTEMLALIYQIVGENKLAEPLYDEEIIVRRKIFGNKDKQFGISLNTAAVFFCKIGNYIKGEQLLIESIDVLTGNNDIPVKECIKPLTDLANLYSINGEYLKSDSIINIIMSKYDQNNSRDEFRYCRILSTLAFNYRQTGDFKKSKKTYLEIASIQKKLIHDKEVDVEEYKKHEYIKTLNRIVSIMIDNDDFDSAKIYSQDVVDLFKKINKKDFYLYQETYAYHLNNLALIYDNDENYLQADSIYKEQIKLYKDADFENLNFVGQSICNLAISCINRKDFTNGEKYLNTIIDSSKFKYNIDTYAEANGLLGILYQESNNLDKAKYHFENYISIKNQAIKKYLLFLTENQKVNFLTNKFNTRIIENRYKSICLINSKKTESLFDNEIFKKGILLNSSVEFKKFIYKSNDTILINLLNTILKLKEQEIKKNTTSYLDRDEILESNVEKLEKKLIEKSETFRYINSENSILSWKSIRNRLKSKEAAIEFISFHYYNRSWTDSIIYAALILRHNYVEPKFVYLFEQKQFDSINIKHQNTSDSSYFNQLYQYGVNGKKLQELIWKPIDSLLEGVETIYAAPSGLLHTINLSALPINNSTRLGDRYNLRIVGSTGELISIKDQYINNSTVNKAWLFGGIDYNNLSVTKPKFDSDNKFNYSLSSNPNTRSGTEKWNYLINTLYEASTIDTMCRKNHINTSFINGKLASKTAFKNISGETKPYILHLATHGYFFPDIKTEQEDFSSTPLYSKQNIFKSSDNPLLRSGLIFSGANKAWSNPKYQSDSTDDGILTALEVSNLDLSEAKLVVMSACETGLGDIKGSEGVFGLQRAFKLAGAKNIIMSLWKVPDTQTKELMKLFYQNCFSGLSVSDALRTAQTEMSKKYPPYYWAAFKLLE
jgi:CHAT domain-containing protein